MDKIVKKQKEPGTSDQSFFRLQNKFRKIPLLVVEFLSYSKITSANLCRPIHDIIKYSTSIYPFEPEKCGKKGKKLQKLEYLKIKNSF